MSMFPTKSKTEQYRVRFESPATNPGVWRRVRVYHTDDGGPGECDEDSDVFELDEPVWVDCAPLSYDPSRVFWIAHLDGDANLVDVWLHPPGTVLNRQERVKAQWLRKLPDMLRIAAEASRPSP